MCWRECASGRALLLFIVAPVIGAGIAGYLFKSGILSADDVVPDRGAGKSDVPPAASAPTQAALGAQSDSVRRHAGRFSA